MSHAKERKPKQSKRTGPKIPTQNRAFRGIWIPAHIWLNPDLTDFQKGLWAEIDSLDTSDGCYASNAYFMDFFDRKEWTVSTGISKLVELGLVRRSTGQDGRRRLYSKAYPAADVLVKNHKSDLGKITSPGSDESQTYNKADNKEDSSSDDFDFSFLPESDLKRYARPIFETIDTMRKGGKSPSNLVHLWYHTIRRSGLHPNPVELSNMRDFRDRHGVDKLIAACVIVSSIGKSAASLEGVAMNWTSGGDGHGRFSIPTIDNPFDDKRSE